MLQGMFVQSSAQMYEELTCVGPMLGILNAQTRIQTETK